MIVSSHQKGWKIITQRAHGLLAGMIAFNYNIDLPSEILIPTIIAVAEHDDGVNETLAEQNLTEAGAPRCFTVKDNKEKTDIEPLQNLMEIGNSKSQLNGLLTSLHLKFLYDGDNRKKDKVLDTFLCEQEEYRKTVLKNLNISVTYANRLYKFLEWCDAFSLIICLNKIQPEGRKMEISMSPDGIINEVFYRPNKSISVEPWPFKKTKFNVFYEFKIVEQLAFSSIENFNEVFKNTKTEREEFVFSK